LRALYFLLANLVDRFHYLKYGLAVVLMVIGAKMLAAQWVHVPVHWSLGVIGLVLAASIAASLALPKRKATAKHNEVKKPQPGEQP